MMICPDLSCSSGSLFLNVLELLSNFATHRLVMTWAGIWAGTGESGMRTAMGTTDPERDVKLISPTLTMASGQTWFLDDEGVLGTILS